VVSKVLLHNHNLKGIARDDVITWFLPSLIFIGFFYKSKGRSFLFPGG
jgi:hypothetical protein